MDELGVAHWRTIAIMDELGVAHRRTIAIMDEARGSSSVNDIDHGWVRGWLNGKRYVSVMATL